MTKQRSAIPLLLAGGFRRRLRVASGAKLPLLAGHKLLYSCNLKCDMCPFWRRPDEKLLSVESERRLFIKLADSGVLFMGFEGGEPLLRRDLPEILRESNERFHTSLVTNGMLLERRVSELARYLDFLFVSVDGTRELHDRLRGVSGSFDRAVQGIIAARDRVPLAISTTLTRLNLGQAPEMVELARNLRVRVVFQVAYNYVGASALRPTGLPFRSTLARLKELKREGAPIVNSEAYFDQLLRSWYDGGEGWECKPWLTINIDPAGRIVLPCYVRNEYGGERMVWETDVPALWASYDWDTYRTCNQCALSCYLEPSLFRWNSPAMVKHWIIDSALALARPERSPRSKAVDSEPREPRDASVAVPERSNPSVAFMGSK